MGTAVVAYTLWLGTASLALALVPLSRVLVLRLTVALDLGPWVLGAVDKVGVIFVVIVWLGWAVYCESVFRRAIGRGIGAVVAAAGRLLPVAIGLAAAEAAIIWALRP